MSRMTRRSAVVAGSLLAAALALPPHAASAQTAAPMPAPTVESVTAHITQALGGQAAWDNTHYLHFNFLGRRAHWWDKWTGRHRVEWDGKEKQHYVVVENINTKEGTAWADGKKLEGDAAQEALKSAYGAWVNDTYWLIMPYKLHDPGVNLAYAGDETIDGKVYDKLALSFGQVGLTPGDHYTVYVNRDTGLVDRWAFILQDMPKDGPPSVWLWQGWQKYGNIMLAPHRVQAGGDKKLELMDIAVFDQLPDSVFMSPDKVK